MKLLISIEEIEIKFEKFSKSHLFSHLVKH